MVSIVSLFFDTLYVSHNCIGESLVDQTVGNLTFFNGQRVFVDLAHASQDVSSSDFSACGSHLTTFSIKAQRFP